MATQSVPASPAVLQFPAVTARIEQITQFELAALLSLQARARELEQAIGEAETSIRERLEAGATIEVGEHTAALTDHYRRAVSWRDVTERLAAKLYGPNRACAYCENVLRNTKPSRSVSLAIF